MTYASVGGTRRRLACALLAATVGATLAACGGSASNTSTPEASGGSAGTLAAKINVAALTDLTGPAGFAGTGVLEGAKVAFEKANAEGFLGGSQIVLSEKDTASNGQNAASLMTQAATDPSVVAVLGPTLASEAAPMAAIAQSSKLPIVFTQSGGAGVVTGPYTFRVTAPQITYFDTSKRYLQSKGVKNVNVIFDSSNSTTTALAEATKNSADFGYRVAESAGVTGQTSDFSAPITSVLRGNPDVVAVFVVGAANATVVAQLRQAGFNGIILAQIGAGAGNLKNAGPAGNNVVWATDFTATSASGPVVQEFIAAFEKKKGVKPSNFNAEGYDAAWLILRGIKENGAGDRESIQKGMDIIAAQGFEGAEGALKFDNRDLRVPGTMVGWNGTTEIPAP